jgi:hypothetical protein
MMQKIRSWIRRNLWLRKLIGYHIASSGLFDWYFKSYEVGPYWQKRIDTVLSSDDNAHIHRHPNAGKIINGNQVMHNGLKVRLGSYYGPEYAKMFIASQGVHEPQEERYFGEIVKTIPENGLMIELGAFWSFYSMWFNREVVGARNIMIEPDDFNLGQGKRNFRLNNMTGTFIKAFVGERMGNGYVSVDGLMESQLLHHIDILHSDIQGFELDMLNGAKVALKSRLVDYLFISTHSNVLHYQCVELLKDFEYNILSSIDLDETFSEDGLIVAASPTVLDPPRLTLSTLKKFEY